MMKLENFKNIGTEMKSKQQIYRPNWDSHNDLTCIAILTW